MLKPFLKTLGLSLLLLLLTATGAYASGKMEVLLGDTVRLQTEEVGLQSDYEWVVTNAKGEIVYNQTKESFNYTFLEGGEFKISVKETDQFGEEQITTVMVLVGDLYNIDRLYSGEGELADFSGTPLKVIYSTLPALSLENTIPLIGEGTVLFDIAVSRPDIIEYRIDRNIFVDGDGDGVANNDIDNAADDSYLRGGVWETVYVPGEATKIVPEITIVTREGEIAKSQAEVIFEKAPSTSVDLLAVIEILPQPRVGQAQVELYDEVQIVGFYSRASQGKILEYRIDENVFVDSNRDGNPANDIDNLNHPSFKNGDVWTTTYQKTTDQIIAQLTVVGEGGLGNRIQREVIFTDRPEVDLGPAGQSTEVFIAADKTVVLKNNPILFQIEGLTERPGKYTYDWDLDGDGKSDKLIEGDNKLTHLYEIAGLYTVTTLVRDEEGNQAELALEVLVKEADETTADFEYSVEGATVNFTSLSQAAFGLTNDTLRYTWSFGDNDEESYKAQEGQINVENPVYTYPFQGTYLVTLTVVDADQVIDDKTIEIVVEEGDELGAGNVDDGDSGGRSGIGGTLLKILKWIGVILLLIIVLGIFVLGAMMLVIKLQHPELTFEELVDELKLKIVGMLGGGDLIETQPTGKDNSDIAQSLESELADSSTNESAPVQAEVISPGGNEKSLSSKARAGIISEEPVVSSPPPPQEATTEHLGKMAGGIDFDAAPGTEGPMPDWLKKAQAQKSEKKAAPTPLPSTDTEAKAKTQTSAQSPTAPTNTTAKAKTDTTSTTPTDTATEVKVKSPTSPNDTETKTKTPSSPGPVPDWLKAGQAGQTFSKKPEPSEASKVIPENKPDQKKEQVRPERPKSQAESGTPTPSLSSKPIQKQGDEKAAPIPDWLKNTSGQSSAVSSQQKDNSKEGDDDQDDSKNPPKNDGGDGGVKTGSDEDKKPKPSSPAAMPAWLQKGSTPKKEKPDALRSREKRDLEPLRSEDNKAEPKPAKDDEDRTAPKKDQIKPIQPKPQLKPEGDKKITGPTTPPPSMPAWLQPDSVTNEKKEEKAPEKSDESLSQTKVNPPEKEKGNDTPIKEEKKPPTTAPAWLQPSSQNTTEKQKQSSSNEKKGKPERDIRNESPEKTERKPDLKKEPQVKVEDRKIPPAVPSWLQDPKQAKTEGKPVQKVDTPKKEESKAQGVDQRKNSDQPRARKPIPQRLREDRPQQGRVEKETKAEKKDFPELNKINEGGSGATKKRHRRRKKPSSAPSNPNQFENNVEKKDQPKNTDQLVRDFVGKKEGKKQEGEVKEARPESKKKEVRKAENKKQAKEDLPEWLQPGSEAGENKKSAQPKVVEEKLPDPLPPLDQGGKKGNQKPENKATSEHVELSMEDLEKGGEFKI